MNPETNEQEEKSKQTNQKIVQIANLTEFVVNNSLKFAGGTGNKFVRAYIKNFRGQLQFHIKIGKKFYRFDFVPATEKQKIYNKCMNVVENE